jgi:hypothetical protein
MRHTSRLPRGGLFTQQVKRVEHPLHLTRDLRATSYNLETAVDMTRKLTGFPSIFAYAGWPESAMLKGR